VYSNSSETVRYLRESRDFVSGQEIAGRLGITRAAVWKHINSLRERGFGITSVTNKGYRLDSVPDLPSEEVLHSLLRTSLIGSVIEYHDAIPSTNTRAMSLGHQGYPQGTVVTADSQTAGKARDGGIWASPPGKNLYLSVLLKPGVPADMLFKLEEIALRAMKEAVNASCPDLPLEVLDAGLFCGKNKIGGVLCEACGEIGRIHHAVAGIGLNVTHHPSSSPASSITELTGSTPSRAELTVTLLEAMETHYLKWMDTVEKG